MINEARGSEVWRAFVSALRSWSVVQTYDVSDIDAENVERGVMEMLVLRKAA